jgi:hypothetical protein
MVTNVTEASLMAKHGSVIMSRRVNCRVWNGNIHNRSATTHPQEKLMFTDFCDSQGPVQEHYQERETTINSARYSGKLAVIGSKHRGMLSKSVVLLNDILLPHTAESLWKVTFDVLAHPPYSPDLAPSGCHLFGPVNEAAAVCVSPLINY